MDTEETQPTIYKHILKVVVFSTEQELAAAVENPEWDLSDVHYAIHDGGCIGDVSHESTTVVPPNELEKELIAIGNDGTFFDSPFDSFVEGDEDA